MASGRVSLRSFFSWEIIFVSATTLLIACLYFVVVPFLELVELKAWDLHFKQRGKIEPSGMVAFVSIDEESVNRDGRWPWPRRYMAKLIKAVESHGALVIGLDMGFFEPDLNLRRQGILAIRDKFLQDPSKPYSPDLIAKLEEMAQKEDDDVILADTIKDLSVPIVLGHFFYFDKKAFYPPAPPPEVLQNAACPVVHMTRDPAMGNLNEAVGLETNIPILLQAAQRTGSFNVFPDPDGSVRWMPLVVRYEERLFPSLALQMLATAFPDYPLIVKADDRGIQDIRLGPVSVPTNNKGELLINYYGPAHSFPHFSATALLHDEAPPESLKGRIVVIGNTTMGLHDMRPTPFSAVFPGVELHCTAIENIIQQQFLQRSDRSAPYYDMAALFGMAAVFLLLQPFLRGIMLTGVISILLGGYIVMTHYAFVRYGLWLNHIYPTLNLAIAYGGTSLYHYLKEVREKRRIRQTFSLYVHRSVVEQMLAHPELLRLGGDKRELTVLFSDIRGFTTLSEQLSPEKLVPQLNQYLTRMTRVVFDHHGTLDKYIGDAVMAVFGAPVSQEDHAYRACATALDMLKALQVLHLEWQEKDMPLLEIGIGVNTGLMMVGNMGSEGRFDYTVLGDNVNLASRLEGLTKMYGVPIVVSETTWEGAGNYFVGRELDVVCVKGRQNPVPIYQVIDWHYEVANYREPLDVYNEAIDLFRRGSWQKSLALFEKVGGWWPADPVCALYRKRCRELLEQDPGMDWSFVTVLDHK